MRPRRSDEVAQTGSAGPSQGCRVTPAHPQKVPPSSSSFAPRHPSPTQDHGRSGVSITLWCDREDPAALRDLFIDFVMLPTAEADPAGWYKGRLSVEGSRKVLERFNRKSFSAHPLEDPGQRARRPPLTPGTCPAFAHSGPFAGECPPPQGPSSRPRSGATAVGDAPQTFPAATSSATPTSCPSCSPVHR